MKLISQYLLQQKLLQRRLLSGGLLYAPDASGLPNAHGTGASTLGAVTLSSAGIAPAQAVGAQTLGAMTVAGEGVAVARLSPTAALLTSGSNTTDATSFATASITPTDGRLLLAVFASGQVNASTVTVTGCNATWVSEETIQTTSTNRRISVFRAMGAYDDGAVTFTADSGTMLSGIWDIIEITDANTGGTDGSGAVIQSTSSAITTNTTITGTLSALEHANNLHISCAVIEANALVTKDADFTLLSSDSVATSNTGLNSSYAVNQTDSTVTFASSVPAIIALEIKAG